MNTISLPALLSCRCMYSSFADSVEYFFFPVLLFFFVDLEFCFVFIERKHGNFTLIITECGDNTNIWSLRSLIRVSKTGADGLLL